MIGYGVTVLAYELINRRPNRINEVLTLNPGG